jgi:hypothetical protein
MVSKSNFRAALEAATDEDLAIWARLGTAGAAAMLVEISERVDFRAMTAREVSAARIWQEELEPLKPAAMVAEELNGGGTIRELEEQLCGEVLA